MCSAARIPAVPPQVLRCISSSVRSGEKGPRLLLDHLAGLLRDADLALALTVETDAEKRVENNIQRLFRVYFEKTLCDSVKIVFKNTHGSKEIRVFEVRIK